MKKNLFFVAAASALMLTACSSDSEVTQTATQKAAPQAVAFDTYTAAATRAGVPNGVMTTEKLKTADLGFGVFAVYQDGVDYAASTKTPSFMFNEHVHWTAAGGWTYAPLKYWPNETTIDSQSPNPATAAQKDKLSFFAYAPYVATGASPLTTKTPNPSNMVGVMNVDQDAYGYNNPVSWYGSETSGILALTSEEYAGDPLVEWKYTANPDQNVDLLWGVAPAGMSYIDVSGTTTTATTGLPLLNMVKPNKDQKMKFLFQHALSRISLSVISAIDQIAAGDDGGKYTTTETRVLIEDVKIWGTFGQQGVLNLNNISANVANWIEASVNRTATTEAAPMFTITAANDYLAEDLRYDATTITAIASDASKFTDLKEGVLPSEKPLLKKDASSNPRYFMVIPSALTPTPTTINVKITYHVVTKDTKLTGNVSNVSNAITKETSIKLQSGKSYNLKLILGLTSVKLDATVADWLVADDAEINLPRNNE